MPQANVGRTIVVIFLLVTGCASDSQLVYHAFGFDTQYDDQDAEVLDYRYGDARAPLHARASEAAVKEGKTFTRGGVHGPMFRGDFLYVKWRNKDTGQVYEDTVDLRQRLPLNITNHLIWFIIRGPQLYVYLIAPKERPPNLSPNGPYIYRSSLSITIYPDQSKK